MPDMENWATIDPQLIKQAYDPGALLLQLLDQLADGVQRSIIESAEYVADGQPVLHLIYRQPVRTSLAGEVGQVQ